MEFAREVEASAMEKGDAKFAKSARWVAHVERYAENGVVVGLV